MGKKTPKYIVFHKPVSGGDDLELLRTYYNGNAYEIVRTADLVEREEW